MNFDWNTLLQIGGIVLFVVMMLRGGCCGGMSKGGGCGTSSKPRREEGTNSGREGDSQETKLRNR